MNRFTEFIISHPWLTLLLILLVTFYLGYMNRYMEFEPDITASLPQKIPAKRLYDKMGEIFPSKEFILVALETDSIFTIPHVKTIFQITRELESDPAIHSVISPTNVKIILGTEEGMIVRDVLERAPENEREMEQYKRLLFKSDLALGNLISHDRKMVGIMILLKNNVRSKDFAYQLLKMVEKFQQTTDMKIMAAGKAIANYYSSEGVSHDMKMFFGGGILVILLILLVIFRTLRGVFLPLVVVIISVIWTTGTMVLLGYPMGHSTEMLPILIMAIGVADSIHILTHYYLLIPRYREKRALVRATMSEMNLPVVMTSITTMAGFLALNTSRTESLSTLGIFAAIGVLYALVNTLLLLPSSLVLLPIPARVLKKRYASRPSMVMGKWGEVINRRPQIIFWGLIVVLVIALLGVTNLHKEFSSIGNFPEDHPVRISYNLINKHFAGTNSFSVMVEGNVDGAIKDPQVLSRMIALEEYARKLPHVGDAQSIADFIIRINKVLHNDDPAYDRIPHEREVVQGTDWVEKNGEWVEVEVTDTVSGQELVAQYLQLYEMSGKPDDFANFVDYNYRNARIDIFLNTDKQSVLRVVDDSLNSFIQRNFSGLENINAVEITGLAKLYLVVDELVVSGQLKSIIASLLLVWFCTSLMFRSLTVGFFNTIPLFFAIFLNFAIMGFTNIPLNLMTMVTSSIAIGVGVDYAIHFIHRYRMKLEETGDYSRANVGAMEESGVAIIFNSVTVALGFFLITASEFVGVSQMGFLLGLTMITAAIGSLTLIPAIFLKFKPASLRIKKGGIGS